MSKATASSHGDDGKIHDVPLETNWEARPTRTSYARVERLANTVKELGCNDKVDFTDGSMTHRQWVSIPSIRGLDRDEFPGPLARTVK